MITAVQATTVSHDAIAKQKDLVMNLKAVKELVARCDEIIRSSALAGKCSATVALDRLIDAESDVWSGVMATLHHAGWDPQVRTEPMRSSEFDQPWQSGGRLVVRSLTFSWQTHLVHR